ncbi:APC family permease [Saccharopolyspora rosea]|uniref:APC family permease n=1 Tax=Saccharopolyspora rosea TaxID=524884 RepID=A0ABW3FVY2_9PSEU|nr:APC family permease [Saccharopolyspora rosea]
MATNEAVTEREGAARLRGSLGVPGVVFLVVAAAAPLTAIGGAGPVALALGNGPGLPGAYLFATAVLLLFSVGLTTMSRHVTNPGAFYAYVAQGIGRPPGLAAAFLALLAYTAIQASMYGMVGSVVAEAVAGLGGPHLPWWVVAAGCLALVAVLGYRQVDLSAKVLGLLLVCEIGIVAVLDAGVLGSGGAHGVSAVSFTPGAFFSGNPGIGVMFAFASFIGFEATAVYGEETRDPGRTVPLSTYVSVLLIGGFYALSSWALVLAWGPDRVRSAANAAPQELIFDTAGRYLGPLAADSMRVLLVTSLFAAILAFHNAIARYLFALGREGGMPSRLGRTHPRRGSPHLGSLVQTASAVLVVGAFAAVGSDPVLELFSWMSGVGTVGIVLVQALTCLAVLVFFRRRRAGSGLWHAVVAPGAGLVGLLLALGLVIANFTTLIGGSVRLAASFGVLVALVGCAGVALALHWRRRDPRRYRRLGGS